MPAIRNSPNGDFAAAIVSARQAVALNPARSAYWLLLMNALAAANRVAEAETIASRALARSSRMTEIFALQRGYLRQRLGRFGPAMDDLSRALQQTDLTTVQKRSARLALADAALAAKDPKRSLDALSPLAGERSYDVAARRGFALQALDRQAEALDAFRLALSKTRMPSERVTMTRGEISALVALGRKDEAKERFAAARSSGDLSGLKNLDIAYLANQVGDDQVADDYFSRADRGGRVEGPGAAGRRVCRKTSIRQLKSRKPFQEGHRRPVGWPTCSLSAKIAGGSPRRHKCATVHGVLMHPCSTVP